MPCLALPWLFRELRPLMIRRFLSCANKKCAHAVIPSSQFAQYLQLTAAGTLRRQRQLDGTGSLNKREFWAVVTQKWNSIQIEARDGMVNARPSTALRTGLANNVVEIRQKSGKSPIRNAVLH